MSTIARLNDAGFIVVLVPPDGIGIAPAERLTDLQRQWVIAHRDTLLAELRIETANDPAPTIQWQAFIDECIMLGVTTGEVASMFRQQDIDDLLEEPDHKLPLHARTIADAVKRIRLIVRPQAPVQASVKRCIGCKHFAQTDHPHIGRCQAGQPMGSSGNWDTDSRYYCRSWHHSPIN